MSEMTIRLKQVAKYDGHNITANGAVNFKVKATYGELTKTIQLMQMLNNDVIIKAKLPGKKPIKLGMFRIKSINIDGDGESKIQFNGLNDYIELDNLNTLPTKNEDDDANGEFTLMYESEVEIEGGDDDGSEDEE